VKGAFSGAIFSKKGLFEEADQGTIFLDEIGEMSPSTQAKILRVLQSGEIRPVGSTATRRVNVRLIAATNKNLASLVQAGKFREDLYYRLKVLHILVPPLRERPEDIEELAYYFLEKYSQALGKHLTAISPEVLALIRAYPWPGNVRELENAIERAVVMTIGQRLTPTDLPEEIQFYAGAEKSEGKDWPTLQELERQHILRTLNYVDWNLGQATELLGISRATLWRKLKAYGIPQKNTA
jgi:transcriptional regulator with PAS, ATPase and Fis domain